jgi:hypothetical protein
VSDARRSWHVVTSIECSAYVPFAGAESQEGNRWGWGLSLNPTIATPCHP